MLKLLLPHSIGMWLKSSNAFYRKDLAIIVYFWSARSRVSSWFRRLGELDISQRYWSGSSGVSRVFRALDQSLLKPSRRLVNYGQFKSPSGTKLFLIKIFILVVRPSVGQFRYFSRANLSDGIIEWGGSITVFILTATTIATLRHSETSANKDFRWYLWTQK